MVTQLQEERGGGGPILNEDSSVFGLSFVGTTISRQPAKKLPSSSYSLVDALTLRRDDDKYQEEEEEEEEEEEIEQREGDEEPLINTAAAPPPPVPEMEMEPADSLSARPYTHCQLVILDDITYFSTMYERFTSIPFAELAAAEIQARVALIRNALLAEEKTRGISLFRMACIHSILAQIEHPQYNPGLKKFDPRPHLKAASTAIAKICALGIAEGDYANILLLEKRNDEIRSHYEGGVPIWVPLKERHFTPGSFRVWCGKKMERMKGLGRKHRLGWEEPAPARGVRVEEDCGDGVSVVE